MTPQLLLELAITPALRLLPEPMDTPAARAMLIAIALQESDLKHRRQMRGGPARGFWQFELGGGVAGVLNHEKTASIIAPICQDLCYEPKVIICHTAIEHHDVLACVFARLLLWTYPAPLPHEGEPETAWRQYLATWRPGKPHKNTWPDAYAEAWTFA